MIRLKNIIEAKYSYDQELYHYTSIPNAFNILKQNKLNSSDYHNTSVISFSRSKYWLYDKYDKLGGVNIQCCFVIDANKLSQNYKLEPYTWFVPDEQKISDLSKNSRYFEYEERLKFKTYDNKNYLSNFSKYIIKSKYISNLSDDEFNELINKLSSNNIEFTESRFDIITNIFKSNFPNISIKFV